MIGFVKSVFNNLDDKITPFSNINYVDTGSAFLEARKTIDYIIPEFIKYISGDRKKSKIYGKIKKFYPEEIMFMDRNISKKSNNIPEQNIDHIKNADIIIEDSCSIYSDLRVVIINNDFNLSSISGYDIITFTKGEKHINTIFIQDNAATIPFTFVICLKLFDRIILNELSELNIPIYNNTIPLLKCSTDTMHVAKFIVDYLYELIYPFYNNLRVEKDEMDSLLKNIYNYNFNIIELDTIKDLFTLIKDSERGLADNYDYIAFIMKVQEELEGTNNIFG